MLTAYINAIKIRHLSILLGNFLEPGMFEKIIVFTQEVFN